MTRFIHDQFAKDYLEELLSPYGQVQAPRRVSGEARQIDVWFSPKPEAQITPEILGLLGRFATTPSIFEPFRNPATSDEICDCLLKLLEIRGELQREAKRNKTKLKTTEEPYLWILTPTASAKILSGFSATLKPDWLPGIHFLPKLLRIAIVAIHQLPQTPETLWLRLIGRGSIQKQAIDELETLEANNPFRSRALELLYNLQQNLKANPEEQEQDDRELIMRLAPLYQQDRELAKQEGEKRGLQQGERLVIENLLKFRFGSLDAELATIIEPILALSPEEFTPLLMQLSREELLARFAK
jgi:hypothetical protein